MPSKPEIVRLRHLVSGAVVSTSVDTAARLGSGWERIEPREPVQEQPEAVEAVEADVDEAAEAAAEVEAPAPKKAAPRRRSTRNTK